MLRYHLTLVLRYPARHVHTVALWVVRPPAAQRLEEIERQGVRVRVTSLVLREVPARLLLADARTVCFAAGADAGELTDDELCDKVVERLRETGAGKREYEIALVLAATAGRYGAMVSAMQRAKVETVIIEDLVYIAEDLALEKGRQEGRQQGLQVLIATLLDILTTRGLEPSSQEQTRISAEESLETLRRWCGRASVASSVGELFADD